MADVKSQLEQVHIQAEEMVKKGASLEESLEFFYTPDCKMLAPGRDKAIEGRDSKELRDECEKRGKEWTPDMSSEIEEVIDLGDVAIDRGYCFTREADGSKKRTGLYLQVWKKVDGQWKTYIDIFTT